MNQLPELLYFFEGRSENRRVALYVLKDADAIIFFNVRTKRLTDFKTRKIVSTDIIYSYYTFRSIYEMMSVLFSQQDFKDLTNKYLVEIKDDIMNVKTNVDAVALDG